MSAAEQRRLIIEHRKWSFVHEAGHVVMLWYSGCPAPRLVEICPDSSSINSIDPLKPIARTVNAPCHVTIGDQILISIAGHAAEYANDSLIDAVAHSDEYEHDFFNGSLSCTDDYYYVLYYLILIEPKPAFLSMVAYREKLHYNLALEKLHAVFILRDNWKKVDEVRKLLERGPIKQHKLKRLFSKWKKPVKKDYSILINGVVDSVIKADVDYWNKV